MAQAVRRDMHKMKAFVRFRTVAPPEGSSEPLHVAWFEPEHHITRAVAPWFSRRFTQMHWALLTPEVSVEWRPHEGSGTLQFGPGALPGDAPPADAGERLWLTYYQTIFNPARLKLKMMQKEMPRKYWHNLPEAVLIAPLAAQAQNRSEAMIDESPTTPRRRIPRPIAPENPQRTLQADNIHSLAELKDATMRCRECPIGEFATQSVPGVGVLNARLMFVGEQPGDQEDLQGVPFVGPAGQLFDRALMVLGLPRDEVFVSNAVKHFKFELRGKRRIHKTPSQQEAAACLHWLEDEIAMVKPKALVALGATAARALMGRAVPVLANRGQWLDRPDGLRVLVTLHPSALLRMAPEDKDAAFDEFVQDLAQARAVFERA
jgi:DNA polymerase